MRRIQICLALALAGCGGSAPAHEDTATSTSTGGDSASTAEATPTTFDDMNHEQRARFMAEVVMPEMTRLFQAEDATRYADFSCRTCHGEGAREVQFRMPNGLHPLDHAAIGRTFQSSEPSAVFMTQRVWPRMAELLGEQPFDMATGEGFRCVHCHADGEPVGVAP